MSLVELEPTKGVIHRLGELGIQTPSVDGILLEIQQAAVAMMREVVKRGLKGLKKEVTYAQDEKSSGYAKWKP